MPKMTRFAPEVRERAVRLLWDHEKEYPSRTAAAFFAVAELDRRPS